VIAANAANSADFVGYSNLYPEHIAAEERRRSQDIQPLGGLWRAVLTGLQQEL